MQESIFQLRKQKKQKPLHHCNIPLYSTFHSLISPRVIGRLSFLRKRGREKQNGRERGDVSEYIYFFD